MGLDAGKSVSPGADLTTAVLKQVHEVARELHPHRVGPAPVTLDHALERDLGLDSLGRVELVHRLERAFDVHLPEQLLVMAETPRDLLRAIQGATLSGPLACATRVTSLVSEAVQPVPGQAQTLVDVLDWHM